jgi:hypothetical protein
MASGRCSDRCGTPRRPSAMISRTACSVPSCVEPPAPKVTEQNSGLSAYSCWRTARSLSAPSGVLGGKNSRLREDSWGPLRCRRLSGRYAQKIHGCRRRRRSGWEPVACTVKPQRGAAVADALLHHRVQRRVAHDAALADLRGCSSNCGLTSISSSRAGASSGTSAGSTSVSEMNDRSPTIRSKSASNSPLSTVCPAPALSIKKHPGARALTPSSACTRGSAAQPRVQLAVAHVHAHHAAAPCCSRQSVKPPVDWPTSRQRQAGHRHTRRRQRTFELQAATRDVAGLGGVLQFDLGARRQIVRLGLARASHRGPASARRPRSGAGPGCGWRPGRVRRAVGRPARMSWSTLLPAPAQQAPAAT